MTQTFFDAWTNIEEARIDQLKVLMEALLKALKSPKSKRWNGNNSSFRNFGWRSAQWVRDKVR
jgi:hypothetical protein